MSYIEGKKVNPRFKGKKHSDDSKRAISSTQKMRFDALKELIRNKITEDRVREICWEIVDNYLRNNIDKREEYEYE